MQVFSLNYTRIADPMWFDSSIILVLIWLVQEMAIYFYKTWQKVTVTFSFHFMNIHLLLIPWSIGSASESSTAGTFQFDLEKYMSLFAAIVSLLLASDRKKVPTACTFCSFFFQHVFGKKYVNIIFAVDAKCSYGSRELLDTTIYSNNSTTVRGLQFVGLSLIERPILISRPNLKLIQIGPKSPPPPYSFLPFDEILGSCHVMWCNFAELYFMHHWTSHLRAGRRTPPLQQPNRKQFWDWIYPFHAISSNFGSAGRNTTPTQQPNRQIFWDRIYPFHAISSNFGSAGRKVPPISVLSWDTQLMLS